MEIKSFAKVNIFLKIVDKTPTHHILASRFAKVNSLFDTISFEKKDSNEFELYGNFDCDTTQNTIFKAYLELVKNSPKAQDFFREFRICVEKKIPQFAGLGGGSSNAAAILSFVNKYLDLQIERSKLANMAKNIGADVPYFVYDYKSANVGGIGENVEEFLEDELSFEIITPDIKCDTKAVFKQFRESGKIYPKDLASILFAQTSKQIVANYEPLWANDLLAPASKLYPQLHEYLQDGWFFSGSGSSFFRIK